jgi:hypothetical protein
MTTEEIKKEYNAQETEKIDNYLKINDIHLDAGMGLETPDFKVRYFQIGGPLNYELILIRTSAQGKMTYSLEGTQEKINELEKLAEIIN